MDAKSAQSRPKQGSTGDRPMQWPAGETSKRFRWACLAIILTVAVAAMGLGGARHAIAQDPIGLLKDLIKKKKDAAKGKDAKDVLTGKKKQLTNIPGKKGEPGQFAPKNFLSKGAPGNNPAVANTGAETNSRSLLPKTGDIKGASPKGPLTKGTTASLTKGANPKNAALPKDALPKGTLPKGALPKGGFNAQTAALPKGTQLKGVGPRANIGQIRNAATPVQRLQLRTDHRRDLFAARARLPVRPLPGQRGFTGVPPVGETRFVSTEMVFQVGPNVSRAQVDEAARRNGLTTIGSQPIGITGGTVYHFRVAAGRPVPDVVRSLEADNIGIAQPNYTYRLFQDTELAAGAGAGSSDQYVIEKLHLDEAHKLATGSNVLIAVIDSAIDINHPDLAGAVIEQYDAVGRPEKPHPHGTGMVGAIVAHQRLMGIAPAAKILAVRAFSSNSAQSPEATTRNILAGMEWAISKGARIINMSFAGPYDPMMQLAMKNAHAKGVVLIAASGNRGPKSPPLYPAADPNVIGVTATDQDDKLFDKAVRGPQVAVAAPGVDVMVPAPADAYQLTTGTSVAAAHVSGVAALLIERYPTVSAATVLEVLTATAKQLNPKGRDDLTGWGLVDPAAALAELESRMDDGKVATAATPAPAATAATPAIGTPLPLPRPRPSALSSR